tara:strand:- start:1656 stop:1892 length:237 start_codon:yes stop_codon:yes gene_type:complete
MKRALFLPKKKSHLPVVVKSIIIFFNLEKQKALIVSNIKAVDKEILSIDKDRSLFATIKRIDVKLGSEFELVFANGGD